MINYNKIEISNDSTYLYIDAEFADNTSTYFSNYRITAITVCTESEVSESISLPDKYIYRMEFEGNTINISASLGVVDFNEAYAGTGNATATEPFNKTDLSDSMFFVFIEWTGTPNDGVCIPCGYDESPVVGVTVDYFNIYSRGMNYIKELANSCKMPQNFINFILNYDALNIAVSTGHYNTAIDVYRNLVGATSNSSSTNNCRCYG